MDNQKDNKSLKQIIISKIGGSMSRPLFYLYSIVLFIPVWYSLMYGLNTILSTYFGGMEWVSLAIVLGSFFYLNKIVPSNNNKLNKNQKAMKANFIMLVFGYMTLVSCGNESSFTTLGNQSWSSTNLNTDRFQNGDLIPEARTDEEWKQAAVNKQPAWCYFLNDSSNSQIYGRLYNFYAVIDPRGLAPKGWRVASTADWVALNKTVVNEYCPEDVERMIEWGHTVEFGVPACTDATNGLRSTEGWPEDRNSPFSGNNSSGLAFRPMGWRYLDGTFHPDAASHADNPFNGTCRWWSSTKRDKIEETVMIVFGYMPNVEGMTYEFNNHIFETMAYAGHGFPVRCIRE
jgi:uncharacterized protein (TIGR02145 family)